MKETIFLALCLLFLLTTNSFQLQYQQQQRSSTWHRYCKDLLMNSGNGVASKKKIVVTGVGAVTPVGIGAHESYQALCEGKSGIVRLPSWSDEFPAKLGGVVQNFDPVALGVDRKVVSRNARYTHFALVAATEAMKDAGLYQKEVNQDRFGCIIGSGIGGIEWFENSCTTFNAAGGGLKGQRTVESMLIPALISNTASGMVALEHQAKGPNYCVVTACASGSHSIGAALKHLRDGEADIMIAGGSEATITPLCFSGFCRLTAMTGASNDAPEKASRPFDKKRAGFVMGEGAGILILETEEHALARGAKIYCELAGSGANCDAHHITAPAPGGAGLKKCMEMALKDANVEPHEVGYINAHGTSTQLNDKTETEAIKAVFGEHAYKLKVSSIKSMIGHPLGAAGGIEAVVCAKLMKEGIVPPTMNCDDPDLAAGCDLDYVPNKAYHYKPEEIPTAVISDNLGFGGHNAALVFKKYVRK